MDVKQSNPDAGKKPKYAAALRYRAGIDHAPVVVASGTGVTAEAILRAAAEAGVPDYVEPALAPILAALEPGTEIPESTYQMVASILAFIRRLDHSYLKR
ncbi:MAG TPA: EscU/YscU/HrcU family type III secretion system export apparatus switch protein [Bacillota bacterium]|nr:EscU/YscU/HrcU family type III secretion system export apparatus switch protein [Bacillota bacterium]